MCKYKMYMNTPEKFRSVGYFDRFVGWTKPKMEVWQKSLLH